MTSRASSVHRSGTWREVSAAYVGTTIIGNKYFAVAFQAFPIVVVTFSMVRQAVERVVSCNDHSMP